jgi:hypothetical protein
MNSVVHLKKEQHVSHHHDSTPHHHLQKAHQNHALKKKFVMLDEPSVAISRVLQELSDDGGPVHQCYQSYLRHAHGSLSGQYTVRLLIGSDRKINSVKPIEDPFSDKGMENCLRAALMGVTVLTNRSKGFISDFTFDFQIPDSSMATR